MTVNPNEINEENVRSWIKTNKKHLHSIRAYAESSESKHRMEYQVVNNYISNLNLYLNSGVYLDHRWGENADRKMLSVCHAKAYDKFGKVKRNKNTWYDDIGWYETDGEHGNQVSFEGDVLEDDRGTCDQTE